MIVELKVPVFPESVLDGTLVSWKKKVGESVARDELVTEIETDKVVFEVPALDAGVIEEIMVKEGATVVSGEVIARINSSAQRLEENKVAAVAVGHDVNSGSLSPSAKKMAAENNLDPEVISGSGKDGRILKEDIESYLNRDQSKPTTAAAFVKGVPGKIVDSAINDDTRIETRVPMSRMRARIAERLLESQRQAAILSTFNELNMQAVITLRSKYKQQFEAEHGVRLGFMSFFVKACTEALKRYPDVNASLEGNEIVYHGYYDIGIAVGSPRGLWCP